MKRYRILNIPWDRESEDLQGRLETAGVSVLAIVFHCGERSKWAQVNVAEEHGDKLMALNGKMYGGREMKIVKAG